MRINGVEDIIDDIRAELDNAKTAPFGKNNIRQIDVNVIHSLLDELQEIYPEEVRRSRIVLRDCDKYVERAQDDAEAIIKDAREQALFIASEREVVRLAEAQADEIVRVAQADSDEVRSQADQFADDRFAALQNLCEEMLRQVDIVRNQLAGYGYEYDYDYDRQDDQEEYYE